MSDPAPKRLSFEHRQLLIGVIYLAIASAATAAVAEFVPPPLKFILLVVPCGLALLAATAGTASALWSLLTATERGYRIGRVFLWIVGGAVGAFIALWLIAISPLFNLVVHLHNEHRRSACIDAITENDDPTPCPMWFRNAVCRDEPGQHPWCGH